MAGEICISSEFIEKELPLAPPMYVSVYLMTKALEDADAGMVAQKLNILESDVIRAWQYWQEREGAKTSAAAQTPIAVAQKPEYSMEELSEYMKHQDMKTLLQTAQRKLGKPLTQQDISMIFGFYDWLGFSPDLIEVLLSYCVSDGFKGMRYVEKVAIAWAEEGIDSVEKAAQYIEMRKTGFRGIMRAFGQSGRMPVDGEEAYMKKWLKEYELPLDVIKMACERTVMQTGKVSFPYADSILKRWENAGVKNTADVEALDRAFTAKKTVKSNEPKVAAKAPKQNRFINYTQRQWDFDTLEKLQREERDKW
ncbi:replication initiation and membrane attachment [Anaerotignum neopropionicum]|uniref:Replication initiation and membrane attachment n=1 Tax=Anaerotignum neopropionicum TaxID=36847 RepID=A0A136WBD5_9FIRM|nr:DnaD domain protein [Anaerotignum neopropionicum]KXL51805.1 replication initiation and membrane attachment [Anaerotignum neopropionicum]